MSERTTIKDIAKILHLSSSTVSRALQNHPDISETTKEKILTLAKELDYHPDPFAQGLKTNQTKSIGVIIPEIKHDFFSSVLDGIDEIAHKSGYSIIVCKSNESYEREVRNTYVMASNRIGGIIVSISQTTNNSDHFKYLQKIGTPIVFFDRICEEIEADRIVVDDYNGAYCATEYLVLTGYNRIAHLAGPQKISICSLRYQGYKSALEKYQIPLCYDLVVYGGLHEQDGWVGTEKLLNRRDLPDAIFAVNDPVALGAYMKIKDVGLKIPDDIALIGFSDNKISSLLDPPLTTVSQPAYDIGKMAAKLLLQRIKFPVTSYKPETVVLKTMLIVRKST